MSRGPGSIETRIGDLFAASQDRALSVGEIAAHAFALAGKSPSRAQRLSTIRAAHRVIRRTQEMHEAAVLAFGAAAARIRAALGRETDATREERNEYRKLLEAAPDWRKADRLYKAADRIGRKSRHRFEGDYIVKVNTEYWRATTIGKGRGAKLWFHAPDVPVQVWAVAIGLAGVYWFEAEVVRITARNNVIVRYAGTTARLDRERLWDAWAWWRGVRFVSSRTGYIAGLLDEIWWGNYGAAGSVPPALQMPLADAIALLGVPANYTREDVIAAFRRAVKKAHPDVGGTAEMFRELVKARDRLLAALGTSAPAPKMPAYYASGTHIVWRSSSRRRSTPGLAHTRRIARG